MLDVSSSNTAICLVAYNRPWHTSLTLASLSSNDFAKSMHLYAYIDGPKDSGSNNASLVCSIVESFRSSFDALTVIKRPKNLGLSLNLTQAVSQTLHLFDQVIVLEDDMITSPCFLEYMLSALSIYRTEPRVVSIHGHLPPVGNVFTQPFFLRGAECWGWATWASKWRHFRTDALAMAEEIRASGETIRFNLNGGYDYMQMLIDSGLKKNDSWAICWRAAAFIEGLVSLHPPHSLVYNTGLDNSGTHCGECDWINSWPSSSIGKLSFQEPVESESIFRSYSNFFAKYNKSSARRRWNLALKLFKKLRQEL